VENEAKVKEEELWAVWEEQKHGALKTGGAMWGDQFRGAAGEVGSSKPE
jgi:hypothetical protein